MISCARRCGRKFRNLPAYSEHIRFEQCWRERRPARRVIRQLPQPTGVRVRQSVLRRTIR